MATITSLKAREILDSRGNPTLEVVCWLGSDVHGVAAVPSGASTGTYEAHELRDQDEKRYNGRGVLQAIKNVNEDMHRHLAGWVFDQASLDHALIALDGTANKSRLGGNALLGVSLAFARACALEQGIELYEHIRQLAGVEKVSMPQPFFNVINGGMHADSGLEVQEFMLAPTGFDTIARKIQAGAEVIATLRGLLNAAGYSTSIGDEGGFAPKLGSNEEAFEFLEKAIVTEGYTFDQIKIGIDAAASSFYRDSAYHLRIGGREGVHSSSDLLTWYEGLASKHPLISIEDGLAEDDWEGFALLTKTLGNKITIVGDDLTVTNVERIREAHEKRAINSVLIKPNQIGTLTETFEAIALTKKNGWKPFMSHRSGETTDTFIADLAVGTACPFIKTGSLTRGERVCKYNRLMEIEAQLGDRR